MFRITPREEIFFDLFVETSDSICKAAEMLEDLMVNYTDVESKINAIEEIEHGCDQQVHKILQQLNKSFITPIDREDIYSISKELDNITDSIESTAHRFDMFNLTDVREDAIKLAKLITQCANELRNVLSELKNMKTSKVLREKIIEVNRIEDDGDTIYRKAIKQLFKTETNAVEVVKWKEIFEYLENTLDACEDVANIIEGVVMKHA
ncbi:MAG: hypothetical protein K0R31_177 [Clostridiales bacterium]|jgi:predicted phosphate transport protein (TIGR00153 family)|nr:hypothetical protein [Clostridiales bacterium]